MASRSKPPRGAKGRKTGPGARGRAAKPAARAVAKGRRAGAPGRAATKGPRAATSPGLQTAARGLLQRAGSLAGKTLFITGASRGIGLAIALRAARDGARIVIAAKTVVPHAKLPGTITSAARDIEAAGGEALALAVDIRDEAAVEAAVAQAVAELGGIDILVNNASAIFLAGTVDTPMKRFDLMHQVNARGTYLCAQKCIPHLAKSLNPHILNLAPPPSMQPRWFSGHTAYTMAKMGMSMCVLGMSEELRPQRIAVNALWPKTTIATAAIQNILGGEDMMRRSRRPEIMGDAAHALLTQDSARVTGGFFVDEDVLRAQGVRDFGAYAVEPGVDLLPDFFLD